MTTVQPVLSGHPWGMAKRPLNRGRPFNRGSKITISKGDIIFVTLTTDRLIECDRSLNMVPLNTGSTVFHIKKWTGSVRSSSYTQLFQVIIKLIETNIAFSPCWNWTVYLMKVLSNLLHSRSDLYYYLCIFHS